MLKSMRFALNESEESTKKKFDCVTTYYLLPNFIFLEYDEGTRVFYEDDGFSSNLGADN